MKTYRHHILILTLIGLLFVANISAYDVKIVFTDGNSRTFTSAQVSRIYVQSSGTWQMNILSAGSTISYDLSQIREVQIVATTDTEKAMRNIWIVQQNFEREPQTWAAYLFGSNKGMCNTWELNDGKITATRKTPDGDITSTASYKFYALYSFYGYYSGGPVLLAINNEDNFLANNMAVAGTMAVYSNSPDRIVLKLISDDEKTEYIQLRRIPQGFSPVDYREQVQKVKEEFTGTKYNIIIEGDTLPVSVNTDKQTMTCTIPLENGTTKTETYNVFFMPDGMHLAAVNVANKDTLSYKGHAVTGFRYQQQNAIAYKELNDANVELEAIRNYVEQLNQNVWYFNSIADLGPVVGPIVQRVADNIYNDTGNSKGEECVYLQFGKSSEQSTTHPQSLLFSYSSSVYVSSICFDYDILGDMACILTGTSWWNNNWQFYVTYGINDIANALLATYDIEAPADTDPKKPSTLILRDRNNHDNVLRLHREVKQYPLRDAE